MSKVLKVSGSQVWLYQPEFLKEEYFADKKYSDELFLFMLDFIDNKKFGNSGHYDMLSDDFFVRFKQIVVNNKLEKDPRLTSALNKMLEWPNKPKEVYELVELVR